MNKLLMLVFQNLYLQAPATIGSEPVPAALVHADVPDPVLAPDASVVTESVSALPASVVSVPAAPVPASLVQQIRRALIMKKTLKDNQDMRPKLQIRRRAEHDQSHVEDNGGELAQESNTKSPVVKENVTKYVAGKYNLRRNSLREPV